MVLTRSLFIFIFIVIVQEQHVFVPVNSCDRKDISLIRLTEIGKFGLLRKARKNVPAHLHTGIDIKRPSNNYINEPVFPIAKGKVISKRIDGAYAQLIIEHDLDNVKVWSLYEHIAGIKVNVDDLVDPKKAIARFMNKQELNQHGWQFDHFHLEILKIRPIRLKPSKTHPERLYNAFSLVCYTQKDLLGYYWEPLEFMNRKHH
jgi:Peptidase family M23